MTGGGGVEERLHGWRGGGLSQEWWQFLKKDFIRPWVCVLVARLLCESVCQGCDISGGRIVGELTLLNCGQRRHIPSGLARKKNTFFPKSDKLGYCVICTVRTVRFN